MVGHRALKPIKGITNGSEPLEYVIHDSFHFTFILQGWTGSKQTTIHGLHQMKGCLSLLLNISVIYGGRSYVSYISSK